MPVQHRPTRRRLAPETRRQQILDAALKVFGRGGYHGTHVDDVIREAGVARGTFYLHFNSKHAVFAALVERMLAIFLEARPAAPEPDIQGPVEAEVVLRASYRTVFETFRRHKDLCRLLFEEAVGIDKGFTARLAEHFQVWHERVAATFRLFVKRGAARKDLDVDLSADLVLGMVERLTRVHLLGERVPDLDRLVEAIVSFELRGISPRR